MEKILILKHDGLGTTNTTSLDNVNKLLEEGWKVKNVYSNNADVSGGGSGATCSPRFETIYGKWLIVLEKEDIKI